MGTDGKKEKVCLDINRPSHGRTVSRRKERARPLYLHASSEAERQPYPNYVLSEGSTNTEISGAWRQWLAIRTGVVWLWLTARFVDLSEHHHYYRRQNYRAAYKLETFFARKVILRCKPRT
jgi:hypothetical protein